MRALTNVSPTLQVLLGQTAQGMVTTELSLYGARRDGQTDSLDSFYPTERRRALEVARKYVDTGMYPRVRVMATHVTGFRLSCEIVDRVGVVDLSQDAG